MLEQMGETPEAVAMTLRARGIRGVRNTARTLNPVVRYAFSITPGARQIDLILGDQMRTQFADGQITLEAVPDAVRQFLDAFHRGEYPDLEMPIDPG